MNQSSSASTQHQRRKFIKQIFAGSLASVTLPALGNSLVNAQAGNFTFSSFISPKDNGDERYWEMVKKQFIISDHLTMVNAANLCPTPSFVMEKVQDSLQQLEKNVSFQYRSVFETERDQALQALANFVGVNKDEIGITRNTSESNNIIVHGLDLKKGDEVLLWDQNHPSNGTAWEEQARRFGFTIKYVSVPANPQSTHDLVAPFIAGFTSKTKLVSFSHISNTSGIALPAKEICTLAKEKNILTQIDGAQSFGIIDLNLKEIGCDFYTGSTHKWLMGPLENGILYINKVNFDRVWPSIVSAGWKKESITVDAKFCALGQRNETTASGLTDIVNFHITIGKRQIENRVKELNTYLKNSILKKIPTAKFTTPLSPELSGGVTIVNIPGKEPRQLFQKLYEAHGIACAPTGGLRFSPHIYNTVADMDKVVSALTTL